MRGVALWSTGGVTSAAANALLLAAFALAIRPLPHPAQHLPPPTLDLVTPDVPQDRAQALDARGQDTGTTQAAGVLAGAVVVPETFAGPVAPPAAALAPAAAQPDIAPLTPATVTDAKVPAASADGVRIAAAPAEASPLAAEPVAAAAAVVPVQTAGTTVQTILPEALPVAAASTDTPTAPPAPARGRTAAAAPLSAPAVPAADPGGLAAAAGALPPPSEHAVATLAWAGEAGSIESASLAAIAAFMQPGDLATSDSNAGKVRDGLEAVLGAVPCARLQTVFQPETGVLELRGHLPDAGLRPALLTVLQAQVGNAVPVVDRTLILPRPQCAALSGIARVGLPQSDEQITNPRVVGPDSYAREYRFSAGDRMVLDLQAPDYVSFVYVDYFDASGNVLHLQPNEVVPLMPVPARDHLAIGGDDPSRPSLQITVSPPFGQEIAVAFAASAPLYQGLRPIEEPAAPYLDWLRDRVAEARAQDAGFKGEWVYFFVSTRAD